MSFFTKKKLLVTHNATFHADDIFATATLSLLLKGNIRVVRTRDEAYFKKGDYVYDVGGEYDPSRNRFDHHQKGGAGARANGVPYAAFGLVWKAYGAAVCGSQTVADKLDEHLVQAIDAHDNGIDTYTVKDGQPAPYLIESFLSAFKPAWNETPNYDKGFFEALKIVERFLERKINKAKASLEAEEELEKAFEAAPDKRYLVLDQDYPWNNAGDNHSELLYVVWPRSNTWRLGCIRKNKESFENRKSLPEAWAGLKDGELAKVTGVADATFCHNGRFLAVAKSKEGAIALAKIAVDA